MACALACAMQDHAEQVTLAAPDDPPSLVAECYRSVTDENGTYARGPLGRPPCPSMGCMREGSRIDSSFGPIEPAERPHKHGGDDFDIYLFLPHPHNAHVNS